MVSSADAIDDCGEDYSWRCLGVTHHHTPGSNPPGGSTWSCPLAGPSCSGKGWRNYAGTMDMWWLFWTMPSTLPFGSGK